jgi:hypothetical protein
VGSNSNIRVAALLILMLPISATAQGIGSQAELWVQRSPTEKAVFLQGFCEGARASDSMKLGDITCGPIEQIKKGTKAEDYFRLCGMAAGDDNRAATTYLDSFYRDKNHSDVPLWAAVATYNDRKCRENNVQGRLPTLQGRSKCLRLLIGMVQSGVSKPVIEKQKAECDSYQ